MILKRDIELVIEAQCEQSVIKSGTIDRRFMEKFMPTGNHIEFISGIRRCGKSTLTKQIIHANYQKTVYFNFEDARVHGFEIGDFAKLDEFFGLGLDAYFFDEIQNVPSSEVFKAIAERKEKVYITGSNATLLSKELETRYTGRHLRHELFPFSYNEFITYKQLTSDINTFSQYLLSGGFLEFPDSENTEVLQNILKDIFTGTLQSGMQSEILEA